MKNENWDGYGRYLEATKPSNRKITTREELAQMVEKATSQPKK